MISPTPARVAFAAFALLLFPMLAAYARDGAPVSVARLSEIAIYPRKTAPATVLSLNETTVAAEIGARIESIPARVGETVEKGALLAELDCADYESARDETEARVAALDARVELAEKRLRRTRELARRQTVAEEALDERRAELAALRADRRAAAAQSHRARADVARCAIRSPLSAVITRRVAAEGEFVKRGEPVLELVDRERLEIAAQVPLRDVERLQQLARAGARDEERSIDRAVAGRPIGARGAPSAGEHVADGAAEAALFFEDSAGRYPLTLRTVVPAVNTATRNREARLVFAAEPALPGAAGKLVWRDSRPHVSGKLLLRRGGDLGVFIYANGRARFHRLAGARQGRAGAVDLPLDTRVITEGQFNLRDGQSVAPQTSQ